MQKAPEVFFERIAGILPMQVPYLKRWELIRCLEVLVKRNLGSERLFLHYIFLYIERQVLKYEVDLYCRMIRAIADKNFVEDSIFWDKHIFQYCKFEKDNKTKREFTAEEARKVWEALIYLKLKCPIIDIKEPIAAIEKYMPTTEETPAEEDQAE
eukprot:CAMPEP_0176404240 /NCGR_PEP_ID=MMETSP0126-20121128/50710_1 /TAXON_ID=141414 ORGANISM="Strombidinopsis acuminatum, Strain SPMC142" /NCGR_SAMPLE_ID=MMETSP0126 /ASSEMBLY_ACC=CAM_ASM_000229 /LENGTH=154 /DNA_ID=CAMNT_0017782919 /DNA_START=536 /DNA_END=1000 /DNA_ORIENTATION=-